MDPVMGTHQRDVPVLCIPGIPHRKVKEEIKEEEDEDGGMEESELLEEHKDLYQDTMVEHPATGTHQRDVPVLCIPGIPHRKVTPSLTIIRVEIQSI
ncbi:unnamed protein product [Staurois parvus]|uniref:Uncharacterized protein n=1 Tax=Staurois parvus TaxID=386267 RepID=A0ABN9BBU6_9NEOB|nr:unnamed protein product [Staurois parvus]